MAIELKGIIAAVYTPLDGDGQLNLSVADDYVSLLASRGVRGIFVCGTTGEFPSLSVDERRAAAEAFVKAAAGRLPVVIHVGHNHLGSAQDLAAHAADIGAGTIAMAPPSFLKPPDLDAVVDWCEKVSAAAPKTPFFYYHIPSLSGVSMPVVEFLRAAVDRVPALAGVKFTFEALDDYALCLDEFADRLTILFGRDEMLLSALALGAPGAVGSSYNFASPLYVKLWDAFDRGDLATARQCQIASVRLIETLKACAYPAASKSCMAMLGVDCGPPRPPFAPLSAERQADLRTELEALGFFEW